MPSGRGSTEKADRHAAAPALPGQGERAPMANPLLPEFSESALQHLRCRIDAAPELDGIARGAAVSAYRDLHVSLGLAACGTRPRSTAVLGRDRAREGLRAG